MKRPSFQFYPADWLTDAALRMVSIGARGMWIDMLCLMHQGSEYGYLKVNNKVILNANLARMIGATLPEVEGWLDELNSAGVYSIDDSGCIFSRRMIRDEEVRAARASGGILGGNPNLKKVNLPPNLKPTPSSSYSSTSSSSKVSKAKNLNYDDYPDFLEFWNAYPNKDSKYKALESWAINKPPIQDVLDALVWQKHSKKWQEKDGTFIPMATTYLNQKRWQDEPTVAIMENPF